MKRISLFSDLSDSMGLGIQLCQELSKEEPNMTLKIDFSAFCQIIFQLRSKKSRKMLIISILI